MKRSEIWDQLYTLLSKVNRRINQGSLIYLGSYTSPEALKVKIANIKKQISQRDSKSFLELKLLFASTGCFQESAIDNDWGDEFLALAKEFDQLEFQYQSKLFAPRWISQLWSSIQDFIFPRLCVVCEHRLQYNEQHLCLSCIANLPKTHYYKQDENRMEQYLGARFLFKRATAFCYFYKEGSLQKIAHEFKYKGNADLAHFIGRLMGSELADASFMDEIDYLIPVPLHANRQRERGYNQAEEICQGISMETGIPVCAGSVIRTVNNTSQTSKNRQERDENVKDIFSCVDNIEQIRGKHILIVDDVITTGATLESMVNALKNTDSIISIASIGIAM